MAQAVARYVGNSAIGVKIGSCILDVTAYDKAARLFKVVECKRVSDARRIGHTFGQTAAYMSVVAENGFGFVDALSKKLHMRFLRWMEGTNNGTEIKVEFYVALPDDACEQVDLLRSLKRQYPDVGIVRVKPDGKCRDYVKDQGKRDRELTKARAVTIKILTPHPPSKVSDG
jgi:hypothetical protein